MQSAGALPTRTSSESDLDRASQTSMYLPRTLEFLKCRFEFSCLAREPEMLYSQRTSMVLVQDQSLRRIQLVQHEPHSRVHSHHSLQHNKDNNSYIFFSSVQCSLSVMSNCLQLFGLQHTRPLCPSPTHRVYPNSLSSHFKSLPYITTVLRSRC